jgi:hypothetical protein
VLAETGAPGGIALPETDAEQTRSNGETWRFVLLLLAAGLAVVLASTPKRSRVRVR